MAEGESAFSGYQLLLEYFTFREKFMFVQLNGLENITLPAGISHFTLEVVFCEVWQSDLPVSASSLRLHCVPVINLFTLEADPLTISGLESEYLLRPKRLQDGHTEIYSVDSVTGSGRTGRHAMCLSPAFVTRGNDASPCAGALLPHPRKTGRNRHARYLAYPRRTAMGG